MKGGGTPEPLPILALTDYLCPRQSMDGTLRVLLSLRVAVSACCCLLGVNQFVTVTACDLCPRQSMDGTLRVLLSLRVAVSACCCLLGVNQFVTVTACDSRD